MTEKLMPENAVLEVLSHIPVAGSWKRPLRRKIVARVGRYPGGIQASRDWWATELGCSTATVAPVFADLVDRKVLVAMAPGKGRRAATYRVNPWIGDWLVNWAIEIDAVKYRAFHDIPLLRADSVPVVARFRGGNRATALVAARNRGTNRATTRIDFRSGAKATPKSRQESEALARFTPLNRATTEEVIGSSGPRGDDEGGPIALTEYAVDPAFDALCEMVRHLLGLAYLEGEGRTPYRRLVDCYGGAAVEAAVRRSPADRRTIGLLPLWLRTALAPRLEPVEPALSAWDEPEELQPREGHGDLDLRDPGEPCLPPFASVEEAKAYQHRALRRDDRHTLDPGAIRDVTLVGQNGHSRKGG